MATIPSQNADPSLASLLGGIINDAKDLLLHEVVMAKLEMQNELQKAKTTAISFAIGAGIAVTGGFLLVLMLVHLLDAFTTIPLWGCYGIIGGGLLVIGLIVLSLNKQSREQINIIPQQTLDTLKENAQWTKEPTTSNRV